MTCKTAPVRGVAAMAAALAGFALPALAQEDTGISSPLISRCAGKFGSTLRQGDQAFPLFSLDGAPWVKIEHADKTVAGVAIADTVTGTGMRLRRRGQVVGFRFTCLVDGKGDAIEFTTTDLLPERKEALPPATLVRGAVFLRPTMSLPRGAELRVQLLDLARAPAGDVLTEAVVRSSWVEPIPFVLRLPPDTKLDGRKLAVAARLGVGSKTLRSLKEPRAMSADELQKQIVLTLDAAEGPRR